MKNDTFSALFPIVIFSSLITAHLFKVELDNKEIEFRKVYVQSLSGQQDDVAENLFVDVSKKIQSDNELGKLIFSLPVNSLDIEQRLRQIHLGGYWEKFEVIVSITDSLCNPLIKTENPVHGNNSFFDEQIESCGVPTVSSSFYFIDHPGSRQRYIARIPLVNPTSPTKKPYTVYLQFESKNRVEETGFPDLLLDQSVNANKNLSDYSFAVYKDGNLLSRSGDYNYPEVFFIKNNSLEEYSECLKNDFHHIASTNKNISTVVSVPLESTLSGLSHYSSFFVFFSFLLIIYFFLRNIINRKGIFPSSFGSRIQFLLVFVVFTALIFFGLATFYVVKDQFENQNKSSIQQQSQVILNEIQKQFENADDLKTSYKDYSNYMVKKISGIFKNDISLFDLRGNLFASSQPRLFDEGIISKKMNPKAYAELIKSEFISFAIKERTGDLEYFSSYHQLKNNNGKILGFVNLPFFAKQGDFEKEVMLYTSALTNIYVLLFVLSVLTALFFSNMLTKPLRLLKQKFRKMSLNRKNEILVWEENDEIGSLVAEYNRMITELEISADKLAASERETAWREMAKQVAHEIKN
ncbi:MAG: HAMP domain-containing protein, partial [Bacteroidota bacterium]